MGSKRRGVEPGYIYHALNRGAGRRTLFRSDRDYYRFEQLLEETIERVPLTILTYQLMPNHWHFVVRPDTKDEMSDFFQFLASNHAKRLRRAENTTGEGHVYQGRFKSFPVESDGHFLSLCRYVERNALRAGLVSRAEQWKWGGLWKRENLEDDWLQSAWPVQRQDDWVERVNTPMTKREMQRIRESIVRNRPYGSPLWMRATAKALGIEGSLTGRGRPPKFIFD